jgi:hypothetical protein
MKLKYDCNSSRRFTLLDIIMENHLRIVRIVGLIQELSSHFTPAALARLASTWTNSFPRILENTDLPSNLDRCYMDLGQLNKGIRFFHSVLCLQLALSNGTPASLGTGHIRAGDLPRTKEYAMRALATDAREPVSESNGLQKAARHMPAVRREARCCPG